MSKNKAAEETEKEQITIIKLELDVPKSKFKKVAELISKINDILKK